MQNEKNKLILLSILLCSIILTVIPAATATYNLSTNLLHAWPLNTTNKEDVIASGANWSFTTDTTSPIVNGSGLNPPGSTNRKWTADAGALKTASVANTGYRTLSLWINFTGIPTTGFVFMHWGDYDTNTNGIIFMGVNATVFRIGHYVSGYKWVNVTYTPGVWQHYLVFTNASTYAIYHNGAYETQLLASFDVGASTNIQYVGSPSGQAASMIIDEITMWNNGLNSSNGNLDSAASQLWNGGSGAFWPGFVTAPANTAPTLTTDTTFVNASAGHSFFAWANATDVDGASDIKATNISASSGTCINILNSSSGNIFGSKWNCTGTALKATTVTIGFTDSAANYVGSTSTINAYPNSNPSISVQNTFVNASAGHSFFVYANASDADGSSDINLTNISSTSGNCLNILNTSNGVFGSKWNCSGGSLQNTSVIIGFMDTAGILVQTSASSNAYPNQAPSVILNSPTDNDHNNINFTGNFSYSDADNDVGNCSLYINGSINQSITSISAGWTLFNSSMNDGSYAWKVGCTDKNVSVNATARTWVLDTVSPVIVWTTPASDNSTKIKTNLTLSIFGSDAYLWSYYWQVNYSNNTIIALQNETALTPPAYTISSQVNLTNSASSILKAVACYEDSHTAKEFKDAKLISTNTALQRLGFEFDTTQISVELLNTSDKNFKLDRINTVKKLDRYTFDFKSNAAKKNAEPETYYFRVTSTEPIIIVKNSIYKGHLITGSNWIDFENPTAQARIVQVNGNYADIEITSSDGNLSFNSLGGLNEFCQTKQLLFDNIPPGNSVVNNNGTNAKIGMSVNWTVQITDDYNLSSYTFSTNTTGSWINSSAVLSTGIAASLNDVRTLTATQGKQVCAMYYYNDSLNNRNQTSLSCFTIANTAPVQTNLTSPANNSVLNNTLWTWLNWTSSDADSDALTYHLEINTSNAFSGQINRTITTNYTNISGLNYNTQYYWKITADDLMNNGTISNTSTFYINDTQPPTTEISTNPSTPIPWNASGYNITITWNASDNNAVSTSYVNLTYLNGTFIQQNSSSPITLINLSIDYYKLVTYASDGNQATNSTLNFEVSAQSSPAINWINLTSPTGCTNQQLNITINATDDISVTNVVYSLQQSDLTVVQGNITSITGSLWIDSYTSTSQVGTYTLLNVTAYDGSGAATTNNTPLSVTIASCSAPSTGGGGSWFIPPSIEINWSNNITTASGEVKNELFQTYFYFDLNKNTKTSSTSIDLMTAFKGCSANNQYSCSLSTNTTPKIVTLISYQNSLIYYYDGTVTLTDVNDTSTTIPVRTRIINLTSTTALLIEAATIILIIMLRPKNRKSDEE